MVALQVESTWVALKKSYIDGFNILVGSLDASESAEDGAVRCCFPDGAIP
jgi:hypothetical protein